MPTNNDFCIYSCILVFSVTYDNNSFFHTNITWACVSVFISHNACMHSHFVSLGLEVFL